MVIPVFGEVGNHMYDEARKQGGNKLSSFFAGSALDLIESTEKRSKNLRRNIPIILYDLILFEIAGHLSLLTSTRLLDEQKEKCMKYLHLKAPLFESSYAASFLGR